METIHGGDIYSNDIQLDFSVNGNPLGAPEAVRKALEEALGKIGSYPDIRAERLRKAVGEMLEIPEEYLLFGNGASELFLAGVHGIRPGRTVIPVPSFYGYEHAAKAGGGEIFYYPMREESGFVPGEGLRAVLTEETDLLFLANPNNPTGRVLDREYLLEVLAHCRQRGIRVMLDECFAPFCAGNVSMIGEAERFKNLILTGAFTKTFGIPGVRLGYLACADEQIRARIKSQLPEWNLSCFAQEAGIACGGQKEFLKRTASYTAEERKFLSKGLEELGITVISGEADFLFLHSRENLYEKLLKKGILIRDCRNFRGLQEGYYRIAVKSREENEILLRAIGEIR